MVFLKVLLLSLALMTIAMAGFMIKVIVKPKGKFTDTSIGSNKAMRKKGIYCIKTEQVRIDKGIDKKAKHKTTTCEGCV